jgi:asparagine synthase (glutamine-hydrolysing)
VCGIAGIINASADDPVSRHTLEAMTDSLVHRGPDASGYRLGNGMGLGHRRLSIIDLSSGDQPMPNEDGTVWVAFNGEIFNYEELRRRLTAQGHVFATESDTEVIVHQYEEDGAACVEQFRGMFAFAIWDERRQQVMLARDRFGIKPLFVAEGRGQLAFASEMRALLASPSVDRSWSAPALRAYLSLGYVPGALTAYHGIRRFAPGTVETWRRDDGGAGWVTTAHRYWRPRAGDGSARLSYGEAKSQLRELLLESVRLRLRSDVPLGAFLSGGVDSTAVVALMRSCGVTDLSTFSMGFEDAEYDELPYALLAARHLETDHHAHVVTAADADSIPTVLAGFDEPFGDSSALPTYLVSRLAREHVTVSLSGDGGDELFAGYEHYKRVGRFKRIDRIPLAARTCLGRLGSRAIPRDRRGGQFVRELSVPAERRRMHLLAGRLDAFAGVLGRDFSAFLNESGDDEEWQRVFAGDASVTDTQLIDQNTYLPDDILTKVDRCSMAVSLEARVPLLDHSLADFVNALPESYKFRADRTKAILKDVMAPYLPAGIIGRRKMGFDIPLRKWLGGPLHAFADDLLCGQANGLLDGVGAGRLLASLEGPGRDVSEAVWRLMSLAFWAQAQPTTPW